MKNTIEVGDIVEVICETPFESDEINKVKHARRLGEKCQVIRYDKPNDAGDVVFTQDAQELNTIGIFGDIGQYINVSDLKVVGKNWEEIQE